MYGALSKDTTWNPVNGQIFTVQFEGFEGNAFTGKVVRMLKASGEVMAQLEMDTELGPLITKRAGKAMIGINLTGLSVPVRAITMQSGQPGVTVTPCRAGPSYRWRCCPRQPERHLSTLVEGTCRSVASPCRSRR